MSPLPELTQSCNIASPDHLNSLRDSNERLLAENQVLTTLSSRVCGTALAFVKAVEEELQQCSEEERASSLGDFSKFWKAKFQVALDEGRPRPDHAGDGA
jgi:hypothetical protein